MPGKIMKKSGGGNKAVGGLFRKRLGQRKRTAQWSGTGLKSYASHWWPLSSIQSCCGKW